MENTTFNTHHNNSNMSTSTSQPPAEFICPIGLSIMIDPWMDPSTGISFERDAILNWLIRGGPTCPVTRRHLRASQLVPNRELRQTICKWQADQDFERCFPQEGRLAAPCQPQGYPGGMDQEDFFGLGGDRYPEFRRSPQAIPLLDMLGPTACRVAALQEPHQRRHYQSHRGADAQPRPIMAADGLRATLTFALQLVEDETF